MIEVKKNNAGECNIRLEGDLVEVTAECVMVMRQIYKKNLAYFPEPEIAKGILTNMVLKAFDIGGLNKVLKELRGELETIEKNRGEG